MSYLSNDGGCNRVLILTGVYHTHREEYLSIYLNYELVSRCCVVYFDPVWCMIDHVQCCVMYWSP